MRNLCMVFMMVAAMVFTSLAEIEIGKPAPDFTLGGTDGKTYSLSQFKGKTVVLEWVNYDCPFVKKFYGPGEMQKLQKEYTAKGIVWLSICSSATGKQGHFSLEQIKERSKKLDVGMTAYLMDEKGTVGNMYGAKTTPHMFIVNDQGVLVYAGAIDDTPSTNSADISKAKNYVRAALDEILAGKPVSTSSTKSYGCSVKY